MRCCALVMTVLLLVSARTAAAQIITEFPIPTAAASIVADPDGALWFSAWNNNIGRITTSGTVTEFAIPAPAPARVAISTNIAVGSDCALWFGFDIWIPGGAVPGSFGVGAGAGIGRITTSGEVSKFLLPSSFSKPHFGITSGPDGALWFTEDFPDKNSKIGRIGQIDENVKADLQILHWERWVLYLEILASLAIIIPERLKRLHLH